MAPQDPVPQRIGDAERDAAVEALQEHHSLGRLTHDEFNDRMAKALQAKVQQDLVGLFYDLPEPKPFGPRSAPVPPGVPLHQTSPEPYAAATPPHRETPWYAQWWMILVAIGVSIMARGSVGFIVPMMAIWLWVIYPSLEGSRRRQSAISAGQDPAARHLTAWQIDQIEGSLRGGKRVEAVKLYREYTGAGLREAKNAVDRIQRQLGH